MAAAKTEAKAGSKSSGPYPVEGDKLKKLVKKSRSMPIPFGFNAGTSDDDDEYLAAHPRKAPEVLGRIALAEGAGTYSAYGTFSVRGSEVHVTCFRSIKQLAKKFKKYLKRFKIILNVVILDPDGSMIESDIETLSDWFQEEEDAEDMAEDAAEAVTEAVEAVMEAASEAGADAAAARAVREPAQGDAAALAARLKSLQLKISATPPAIASKLTAAFKAAVMLIKAGELESAARTVAQIQAVFDKLASMPAGAPTASAPAAPEPPAATGTPAPAATTPPDPRLQRMRDVLEQLSAESDRLFGAGKGPVAARFARVKGLIEAGEAEAALTGLRSAQRDMHAAKVARAKWTRAQRLLEGLVAQAVSGRLVADPDDLRDRWQSALSVATEGGWDRALQALPEISAILRAGARTP